MPRKPRMYLAGIPCHVTQRGNNRSACFFAPQDYRFYLDCLEDAARRYGVAVHAHVLMTNHVHLLMTPTCPSGISRVMQSVGRRYVQYVNQMHQRCGTLWQGRHKASLIEAERYLLACYRYIELNPVRANMVRHPGDYPWSSFRCNAMSESSTLVTPHSVYRQLGVTDAARHAAYRALFETQLEPATLQDIRTASRFSMPLGSGCFKADLERALGKPIGQAKRGRPLRDTKSQATIEN